MCAPYRLLHVQYLPLYVQVHMYMHVSCSEGLACLCTQPLCTLNVIHNTMFIFYNGDDHKLDIERLFLVALFVIVSIFCMSFCLCVTCLSVCLSVICLSACLLSVCLPVCYLSACLLSVCLPVCYLSVCLSAICLSACLLSVCLPVCSSV